MGKFILFFDTTLFCLTVCRAACPKNKFGVNCTETCHCLNGTGRCDDKGQCGSMLCEPGWQNPPSCQTNCSDHFGINCFLTCHCPPGDDCNPISGQCSSNSCHPEWAGPACQIRLPRLISPLIVAAIDCQTLSVKWKAWMKNDDVGEPPMANYLLQYRLKISMSWKDVKMLDHKPDRASYEVHLHNLTAGSQYVFRVIVSRWNVDHKLMRGPPGWESAPFTVACPHSNVIESVTISNSSNNTLLVKLHLLPGGNHSELNISAQYSELGIVDCNRTANGIKTTVFITDFSDGSFLMVRPWRWYMVDIMLITTTNILNIYHKEVLTQETAPSGYLSKVSVQDLTSKSAVIIWDDLQCTERGGMLLRYDIKVRSINSSSTYQLQNFTDKRAFKLHNLQPYTFYGIQIRYVNSVAAGKYNKETLFLTREDVPDAPFNITMVALTDTEVNISWLLLPNQTNGNVIQYAVAYSLQEDFQSAVLLTQSASNGTTMMVFNLLPFTKYHFRVKSKTKAGWGPFSSSEQLKTLEGTPTPPMKLLQNFRNESCVGLVWKPPISPNGILKSYLIRAYEIFKYFPPDKITSAKLVASVSSYLMCGLKAASVYKMMISASTGRHSSVSTSLQVWTEHKVPSRPLAPTLINYTTTTITVELHPVILVTGPLSGYQVFVHHLTKNKREVSDKPLGYVALDLLPEEILEPTLFVIGDGSHENTALQAEQWYDIYYAVLSTLYNVTKISFSKMEPVFTSLPPDLTDKNLKLILVTALILSLLIAVLIFMVWRHKHNSRKTLYRPNVSKMTDVIFSNDDCLENGWSQTQSLYQRRFILAGRQYLPDLDEKDHTLGISFQEEYQNLPHGKTAPWNVALEPDNVRLNRFLHLLPYDHSRVCLRRDESSSVTYINANYIDGWDRKRAYIAAQSPFNEETVLNFWKMIYQKSIQVVVMITDTTENNITKCTRYWPASINVKSKYGPFILEVEQVQNYANYMIINIKVTSAYRDSMKKLTIYEYLSWPEQGVPADAISLLEMWHKIRQSIGKDCNIPALVHCGTGVGRTGIFIAVDALIQEYQAKGEVSVFQFINGMRKNRISMVRTLKEYIFVYKALFEALHLQDTVVGRKQCTDLLKKDDRMHLNHQFFCLQQFTPKVKPEQCKSGSLPENITKNRFSDVLPVDRFRPSLSSAVSKYINAIFLDGNKNTNHFILTQSPLQNTVNDFWQLVYDFDVRVIVMVEKNKKDTCAEYWKAKHLPTFSVQTISISNFEKITVREIELLHSQSLTTNNSRQIVQIQYKGWREPDFIPSAIMPFLKFIRMVDFRTTASSQILVHCKDGATHSGLFCALSIACESMRDVGEVDLYRIVKRLKQRRTQIVNFQKQYTFCYKALLVYTAQLESEKQQKS